MTTSNRDPKTLLNELVVLARLTRTEAQIARVRVGQARREETRRELQDNAREADERAARLQDALRRLGGTPDVLADAVGRVTALTKATLEQAQPFSEGLLGDLALEHQLRDRVVFARVLAEAQDETAVVTLMQDLEAAHTETIEWIRVRLAEVAQGGPVALAPTPAQAAIGTVTRIAMLPSRRSAALFNKAVDALQRGRSSTQQAVGSTVQAVGSTVQTARQTARQTVQATGDVIEAGRDAALARAEQVAPSAEVRRAVHESRKNLGVVAADELPVKEYDTLTAQAAITEINDLQDAEDIRVVLRYEQAHKDRNGVSTAAQKRLTELAQESVTA